VMPTFRMLLSLAVMIPAWAALGAFARLDAVGPGGVLGGLVVGGAVGVVFGLMLGGAKGKWVDFVFGPEDRRGGDRGRRTDWRCLKTHLDEAEEQLAKDSDVA
jgi:hypothetical protein